MAALATHRTTDPVENILSTLNRDGGLILEDLLSAEQLARLRSELDPYIFATQTGRDDFGGVKTTRTGALIARSQMARELAINPLVLAIVGGFLGPSAERFQLHISQVIRLMPGQPAQPLHRDQWAWSRALQHLDAELSFITAVTEFTAENGATLAVPGSGTWPDDRRAKREEICQAVMKPGSAIVYSGRMFHGGGENRSSSDRIGMQLSYTLGWLRQEENQYLSCPPDIARTLPREVTRLIGYDMGRYALGYFTPPAPPAESLEVVNPEFALTGRGIGSFLGGANDAEELLREIERRNGETGPEEVTA